MNSYTARRTPVHRGTAAWSAILPGQPAPVTLDGDLTVDFALVGGGFAGLSAARRLMQLNPGAKIAVLEASRLAEGASGRNSGFMIDLPHELQSDDYAGHGDDRAMIDMNRGAIAFAADVVADYGIDPNFSKEGLERANALLSELGGGSISQVFDFYYKKPIAVTIKVKAAFVGKLLGVDFTEKQIKEILQALSFQVRGKGILTVQVPSFRGRNPPRLSVGPLPF